MKWRPDIEGLRGIAVLLVVLYHAGVPWLGGGFVGVDVFFVLSGYLITRLLVDELTYTGTVSLRAFYARRIRRLLPAAALVIVATLAVSQLVLSPLRQVDIAGSAMAAAAYAANVVFAVESADYFGADVSTNPLLHMWSLSVEEQFYVVWPVLLLLAWRFGGRRGLAGALAIVAVGGFALSAWLVDVAPQWAFYGTHSRAWQFAVGGLAGLIILRGGPVVVGVGWVGLAAVLTSGAVLTDIFPFPGAAAVPVTLGTAAALIAAGAAPSSLLGATLSMRPLRELGRLSYSWYLWHWPALVLVEVALGPLTLPAALAVAVASLALAAVTYRLVENPVRHHRLLVSSPRAALLLLAALTGGTALVALGSQAAARSSGGPTQALLLAATQDRTVLGRDNCYLDHADVTPRGCWYGSPDGSETAVLIGDSHAAHLFPALELVALNRGWRLQVQVKAGCSIVTLAGAVERDPPYPECVAFQQALIGELERLRPDVVLVSGFAASGDFPEHNAIRGAAASLQLLGDLSGRVVFLRDIPVPPRNLLECLSSAVSRSEGKGCRFDRDEAMRAQAWELDAIHQSGVPVDVVDLSRLVCPAKRCGAMQGDLVVYRDADHITASFARTLAPGILEQLQALGSEAAQAR
jgi:peptidoglycan/LPS O-acetylase OafA/YrhL